MVLVKWYGAPYGLEDGTVALVGWRPSWATCIPCSSSSRAARAWPRRLGVLLGINGWLGLATALTWLIIAFFFRYSSLASLVAVAFAPAYYVFGDRIAWYADKSITLALLVIGLFLAWRHRENINRLVAGTESKLGAKK